MEPRLVQGQAACDFEVTDVYGNLIRLKDFHGKKLLISFQRGTSCPFCNLRVHQLNKKYQEYSAKGLEILVVFESSKDTILKSEFLSKIAFPVIADSDKNLYEKYRVELSFLKTIATFLSSENRAELQHAKSLGFELKREPGTSISRIPAEFLVDENLIVYEAYYGNSVADHIPLAIIEEFLEKSQHVLVN